MAGYTTCPDCKGSGEVEMPFGYPTATEPCGSCFGSGEVCDQCAAPPQTATGEDGETVGGCWHHY